MEWQLFYYISIKMILKLENHSSYCFDFYISGFIHIYLLDRSSFFIQNFKQQHPLFYKNKLIVKKISVHRIRNAIYCTRMRAGCLLPAYEEQAPQQRANSTIKH